MEWKTQESQSKQDMMVTMELMEQIIQRLLLAQKWQVISNFNIYNKTIILWH